MLDESEFKQRLGLILGIEELGDQADWFAISRLSVELIEQLPDSVPTAVRAYLADCDIRRVSRNFAHNPRLAVVHYLRSADALKPGEI